MWSILDYDKCPYNQIQIKIQLPITEILSEFTFLAVDVNSNFDFLQKIYFSKTIMGNSFLVHFVLRWSKIELERTKFSKLSLQYLINEMKVSEKHTYNYSWKNQAAIFSILFILYLFETWRKFKQIQPPLVKINTIFSVRIR